MGTELCTVLNVKNNTKIACLKKKKKLMASTAVAKYRNSPIHYIKLKPGSGFDIKAFKSLTNIFSKTLQNDKLRERNKSSKGRKISNFIDDKGDKPTSNVNFIQLGSSKTKAYKKKYK